MAEVELVFIGGAPRSGTGLMQRILNGHTQVYAGPEFDVVPKFMRLRNTLIEKVRSGRISAIASESDIDASIRLGLCGIFQAKAERELVKVFSEKTPSNSKVFKEILEVFPESKCLMLVRDPRAVVASMLEVGRRFKADGKEPPIYCQNSLYAMYQFNSSVAPVTKIEAHPRLKIIHYEDLVNLRERITREICDFIGIEFEPQMTKPSANNFDYASVGTEYWSTEKAKNSDVEKMSLEKWKAELSNLDLDIISNCCLESPLLSRYEIQCNKAGLKVRLVTLLYKIERRFSYVMRRIRTV